MQLNTSLKGRLRNTRLPKSHALLPIFEAVVNSIQAIDARGNNDESGSIVVSIIRDDQLSFSGVGDFGPTPQPPITAFELSDDGEGFIDRNLESFNTLDSDLKADRGGRGVGRLLWLKAFSHVQVNSIFTDPATGTTCRRFRFDAESGVSNRDDTVPEEDPTPRTTIRLVGFREEYRASAPKTAPSIARAILEHCLWYFIRPGGPPVVKVVDDDQVFILSDLFDELMLSSADSGSFVASGQTFDILHVKLRTQARTASQLSWCADSRVVLEEGLAARISGLYGKLSGAEGDYFYNGFLTSSYLDRNVLPERTEFALPESADGTLADNEPTRRAIRDGALSEIEDYLSDDLETARSAGRERVERYVSEKSPRYRPILQHIEKSGLSVDPNVTDKELEVRLHRELTDLERSIIEEGQEVLRPDAIESGEDYQTRLRAYLERVEDIKKSDLAAYVSRRRVILDLFERAIRRDSEGRYEQEDTIHNLIMPMRTTSNEVSTDVANLWLIDEGLAFHHFLASDKTIRSMPVTGADSLKEPDLLALRVLEDPTLVSEVRSSPLPSLTVIEIKRPMRNDARDGEDKDPIQQALGYLKRVRAGGVTTASGRPIANAEEIPGFVYVVADLTSRMEERCQQANLTRGQDGMSYFGYNSNFKAYIEVLSFDRVLESASRRNRAFFDQLGLPAS